MFEEEERPSTASAREVLHSVTRAVAEMTQSYGAPDVAEEIRQFVQNPGPHAPELYFRVAGVPLGEFFAYGNAALGATSPEVFFDSIEEHARAEMGLAGDPVTEAPR